MIQTAGAVRVEIDLSRIAEAPREDAGRALVRAILDARGGEFARPGVVVDAELRGDSLAFQVLPPDEEVYSWLNLIPTETIYGYADELGAHEDCHTEDQIVEAEDAATEKAEEEASNRFEALIEHLLGVADTAIVFQYIERIKAKYDEQGTNPGGSMADAFEVLGMAWK